MLIKEAEELIVKELSGLYSKGESVAIATLLLEYVCKIRRNVQAWHTKSLPISSDRLYQYITELKQNRPIQYVIGEAWFYDLRFEVNESVLIPRPETEELVEMVIKEVRSTKYEVQIQNADNSHLLFPIPVLDIGTGSGCIPVSIKTNTPEADVSAIDVCSEALHVAINNAVMHETEINFHLLDFLDERKWNELGMFDIIISNPPYIKTNERQNMSEHVLQYEPHKALFVPDDDALLFYKKIADFSLTHLSPHGRIYVEVNQQLGKETAEVFLKKGFNNVELLKDMSGNERFVKVSS
ncbi:MAG: peptide chain release factor N(5)-glutamine methyltransferase [Chitinophagaceae bacterium]|nr:peptide chain release factor N(5)-glutamine methyltransferase [Chitinophagaceae bacterium]